MKKLIKTVLTVILCVALCAGCKNGLPEKPPDDGKLLIYTSFYPMYDLAKKAVGDSAEVRCLIPNGAEPHEWEPSPQDIIGLEQADIFVYSGGGMETWADSVIQKLNSDKLLVVKASPKSELIQDDPHTWLYPIWAKEQFSAISNAVISLDSDNTDIYTEYMADTVEEFDRLDAEYSELKKFSNNQIIVTHGAFGYLCAAYGLEQISITPVNSEDEPTPARMAEIVSIAKENNIKYVFYEGLSNLKLAQAVSDEIGGDILRLSTLEELSDEERKNGDDYFSIMRKNLAALREALS